VRQRTLYAGGVDLYDVYAYRGATMAYTGPAHIALCSRWSGGPAPVDECYSVAELGCGDGGNLLPLAFYHPACTFLGLDSSPAALARAQADASRLGLANVRFVCVDIRDVAAREFGAFEYIIVHGLYSWVPDNARAAILRFCRDGLAPSGLAYISYNAQPGWSTRQLVRDTLRRSQSVREADIGDKAVRAIEVASRLLEDIPSSQFASTVVLAAELERVRSGQPSYVFHEYLADTNDGFWLRDFVERARLCGLAYVIDAHFCRWEGQVPRELRTAIAQRRMDPVDEEETIDLLGHRYFRASILARADASKTIVSHDELIECAHIAAAVRPQSLPLDLDEGVAQQFVGVGGSEITIDFSVAKAALALLGPDWPRGIPFEWLYQRSLSFLARNDRPAPPDGRRHLLDAIKFLFEAGQVDLRVREPACGPPVSQYPTAHSLARWEAEGRNALTTPHHLTVAFDPDTMDFVRSLDGSRSRSELQHEFGSEFVDRTLPILGRCGLLVDQSSGDGDGPRPRSRADQ
jgi:SAM-dependent methyltransferase